jgi:uncharacterized protein YbaA (DUF1428 family)
VSELVAGFWIWRVSSMDDVPEGAITFFAKAVKKQDDEAEVFGWIRWPSRGARDERRPKAMADARLSEEANPMPFDGSRLTYGGFETIVERQVSGPDRPRQRHDRPCAVSPPTYKSPTQARRSPGTGASSAPRKCGSD